MRGLFETLVDVTDLDRSLEFYAGVLGLELVVQREVDEACVDAHSRGALRFALPWVGGRGHALLGLWEERRELIPHIPTASIYFDDPDGDVLELLAPISAAPRPDMTAVSWDEWTRAMADAS